MLTNFYKLILLFLVTSLSQPALAHLTGEHSMGLWQGVLHFLSSPVHLFFTLVLLIITYAAVRSMIRRSIKTRIK